MKNGINEHVHNSLTDEEGKVRKLIALLKENFVYAPFSLVPKAANVINLSAAEAKEGLFTYELSFCTCITLMQLNSNGLPARISMYHSPGGLAGWVVNKFDPRTTSLADPLLAGFEKDKPLQVIITDGIANERIPVNRSTLITEALNQKGFTQVNIQQQFSEYIAVSFKPNHVTQLAESLNTQYSFKPRRP